MYPDVSGILTNPKVCFVTGAARGLGFEFCRAFIQAYGDRLLS